MKSSPSFSYLTKEAFLILLLSYFTLIGGSYKGMVVFQTRFLSHVLTAIILIIWLANKVFTEEDLPSTSLHLPIVALLAAHVVATVSSEIPRLSLEGLLSSFLYVVLFYMMIDLLRQGWPVDLLVKSLLVVGGITCILAALEALEWYLSWFAIGGLAHPVPPSSFRIVKTLGPNPLAAYVNLLIPVAVVTAVGARRRGTRLVVTGWLVLAVVVQLLTFSRGGWLGLLGGSVALAIMLILQYRQRLRLVALLSRLVRRKILAAALITGVLIGALPIFYSGYHLLYLPSRWGSVQERVLMWRSAWSAFLDRPLTGTGLWTYGTQFLRYSHVDLRRPVEKAHNVVLMIMAESGILGLAASLWLSGAVIIAAKRRWHVADENQRLLITACMASLVGALAHGLVEEFLTFPFFMITAVLIVAAALGGDEHHEIPVPRRISHRWLVGPVSAFLVIMLWTDIGYFYFSKGAELATDGKWAAGAQLMERAIDLDPALPFYRFQLGFAYGQLASRAPSPYLDRAIEQYEMGLSQEPYYSLNHANLAGLYWQKGQPARAIQSVQQATALAPRAPEHAIQLGSYYEQVGSYADALQLYRAAIQLNPPLIADLFWENSELRREFIEHQRTNLGGATPSSPVERGKRAYHEERYEEAAAFFQSALATQPANNYAHSGLGLAHLALGEEKEGVYHLQVAIFLRAGTEPHLALGRLAYEQGDLTKAISQFEAGLIQPIYSDFYGPAVYRREGIYQSRLPQLPRLGLTETLVDGYLELAKMYEEANTVGRARDTYLMLLEWLPHFQPALDKLESLENT